MCVWRVTGGSVMGLVELEVLRREPYENACSFSDVGPYERIDAIAHYAVDPESASGRRIVGLDSALRRSDGLVHFSGDVVVLRPMDASRSNRLALLDLPNRGRRIMTGLFNRAVLDVTPGRKIPPVTVS